MRKQQWAGARAVPAVLSSLPNSVRRVGIAVEIAAGHLIHGLFLAFDQLCKSFAVSLLRPLYQFFHLVTSF